MADADPGAAMSFLAASAPEFYADQDACFDGDAAKLPEKLRKAVTGEQAGLLLLSTKWRGEAAIPDGKTTVGSGKIAGLGFCRYARREGRAAPTAGCTTTSRRSSTRGCRRSISARPGSCARRSCRPPGRIRAR